MPFYDYRCDQCGHTFEKRVSFQEKDLGFNPVCPNCSNPQTRQVISAGTFIQSGNNSGNTAPQRFCGPSAGGGCCG